VYFTLYLVGKIKTRRTFTGLEATSTHTTATAMLFPANAGLIFLTDELTRDRIWLTLGQHWVLSLAIPKPLHLAPLLKGADGQPIPSWGFVKKIVQFQAKLFSSQFL
jgi:hypothetical protein